MYSGCVEALTQQDLLLTAEGPGEVPLARKRAREWNDALICINPLEISIWWLERHAILGT
jgi:hypothetical protein